MVGTSVVTNVGIPVIAWEVLVATAHSGPRSALLQPQGTVTPGILLFYFHSVACYTAAEKYTAADRFVLRWKNARGILMTGTSYRTT